MRNVFLKIRQYFNLIFFLTLQIIACYILFHYNRFHEAVFMGVAGEVTGFVNERYSNVEGYFSLRKTNVELMEENTRLRNLLKKDFEIPDSSSTTVIDSIRVDSIEQHRKYQYYAAKVINNSVTSQNNYITINRGYAQGIAKDMSVISPSGIVGTVVNVSKNMAIVMSLLHSQSGVSASLKKTGETGRVEWDGKDPQEVVFKNIPKSVRIEQGDTVVTSLYSTFPAGYPIGIVNEIADQPGTNFYLMKIKPLANFYNLQFVYVIRNLQKEEQDALEKTNPK